MAFHRILDIGGSILCIPCTVQYANVCYAIVFIVQSNNKCMSDFGFNRAEAGMFCNLTYSKFALSFDNHTLVSTITIAEAGMF